MTVLGSDPPARADPYLDTGDPPEQAARATAFLAQADEVVLADLVVAEIVYVLESSYEVARAEVARLVRAVIAFRPIRTVDRRCSSGRSSSTSTTGSTSPRRTWW